MENLIANVDNVKPKGVKAKVEEHAQLAMMSKRLATINTQVPMDIDFAEYKLIEPDYDALIELYSRLEFNRFLKKLNVQRSGGTGSGDPAAKPLAVDAEKLEKVCVREDSQLEELTLQGKTAIKVFGDHNHLDVPQIEGVAAVNGDTYYYFDCRNLTGFFDWLAEQEISFAGHSLKDDYYMLLCHGMTKFETAFDTEVAQYVLDSSRSNYSLSALSNEYLHQSLRDEKEFFEENGQVDLFTDPTEQYMTYGCEVCGAILNLAEAQKAQIADQKLETVLYEAELPLVEVMASMEHEGFRTDKKLLEGFGVVLAGADRRADEADLWPSRRRIQHQFAAAAGQYPVRKAGAACRQEDEAGIFNECRHSGKADGQASYHSFDLRIPDRFQAEKHLCGRSDPAHKQHGRQGARSF